MTQQILSMGISAIQANSREEGARLIRIALKHDLPPELVAIAYMWLAETQDDPQAKRQSYQRAVDADPNNADARQRLAALMSVGLPSAPPARADAQTSFTPTANAPQNASAAPRRGVNVADALAQVIGGPAGVGSAVFVDDTGILATTRRLVRGLTEVMIELTNGQQTRASVLRSYLEYDLALLYAGGLGVMLPITPLPRVPDEARLNLISFDGTVTQVQQRPTKRLLAPHWIPMTATTLPNAGGMPILDEKNYLVGIVTRLTSGVSPHLFGLHISLIRQCVEDYMREAQNERRVYCPDCGSLSRAAGAGFFYCEVCGSVTPGARGMNRYPAPQADAYYGANTVPCRICGARAGYHNNQCLRCGQPQR